MSKIVSHRREVEKATQDALRKTMEWAALRIEADAKRLCPVDTGNLRRSITHEVSAYAGEYAELAFEARVGSNVKYASYVELGTSKMSPQPYLRPAMWRNMAKIQAEMRRQFG